MRIGGFHDSSFILSDRLLARSGAQEHVVPEELQLELAS